MTFVAEHLAALRAALWVLGERGWLLRVLVTTPSRVSTTGRTADGSGGSRTAEGRDSAGTDCRGDRLDTRGSCCGNDARPAGPSAQPSNSCFVGLSTWPTCG